MRETAARTHAGPGASVPVPVIALVGRPNVGKSTFLARASGRFAEAANVPGTTVGAETRRVDTAAGPTRPGRREGEWGFPACGADRPAPLAARPTGR